MGNKPPANMRYVTHQQGSVIIISLVLLLVLTVLGLAGMKNTVMEERMAMNTQNDINVFHEAESDIISTYKELANDDTTLKRAFTAYEDADVDDPTNNYPSTNHKPTVGKSEVLYRGNRSNTFGSTANIGNVNRKIAYQLEIKGTGELPDTNAKAINVQGTVKGPYPYTN